MADTKVTGLDALTVPADVDLLYIVDDPAGLPIGKKITVGNLLARAYGSMYVSTSAPTTIVTPGTFAKAAGTTTELTLNDFDMPASNRLRYTGSGTLLCVVEATVSMTAGANNQLVCWRIAKKRRHNRTLRSRAQSGNRRRRGRFGSHGRGGTRQRRLR